MSSNLRQAAQQALEAIDRALPHAPHRGEFDALADMADAIRAALATCKEDLQVEPVAWMDIDPDGQRLSVRMWSDGNRDEVPLYTAPPQRKPLTDDQITAINASLKIGTTTELVRAVERAHGIGGGGGGVA